MNVTALKSTISDNYFYLVSDRSGHAALIDPVDAPPAIAAVREAEVELDFVVNTHFHHDHTAGDDAVLDAFPHANLLAGPDADRIEVEHPIAKVLTDGDEFHIGAFAARVLEMPGHTSGHIGVLVEEHLFSGDTIFVGGVGNCLLGGDPGVLFATFRDVIAPLSDDVTFYPGHDYARRNIEFALSLEPQHGGARQMLERVERHDDRLFLTSLGEERSYNPFMRWNDPSLLDALTTRHGEALAQQRALSASDGEAVFRTLRELRNHW